HHRPHHPRRPRHHHDAAPGTRLPRRPELLVPGRLERRRRLDAHVPQRTGLGRLTAHPPNKDPGQASGFFMHQCRAPARMNSLSPRGRGEGRGGNPSPAHHPRSTKLLSNDHNQEPSPMKIPLLTAAILLTTACTTPPPTKTHIYKPDGNKQCEQIGRAHV